MQKLTFFTLFFIGILFASHARVPACGESQLTENFSLKYCLYLTDRTKNKDIIFYLHGRGGNAHSWSENYGKELEKYWRLNNLPAPTIIAISFGPQWFLTEFPLAPGLPPLQELYTNILIPNYEAMLGGPQGGRRMLVGESMGGYNASMLFLKRSKLFAKVAILCPAIPTITPFSTTAEIEDYMQRTGADRAKVEDMVKTSRALFPTTELWLNHSPLDLVRTHTDFSSPELYLSCGDKDEYGFFEGTEQFSKLSAANGVKQLWVPISEGVHCSVDTISLATFLQ